MNESQNKINQIANEQKDIKIDQSDKKSSSSKDNSVVGSDTIEEMKLNTRELSSNQANNFQSMCFMSKIRHLVDYGYESEDGSVSKSDMKSEEAFLIVSDQEQDSDVEYIGSNKQLKKEEKGYFF